MIVAQVSEHGHIETASIHPRQIQGMRRDLHDGMGGAIIDHLPKNLLQISGFRRGHRVVKDLSGVPVIDCSHHPGPVAGLFQDTFYQIGNRGLATGTGHAHQCHLLGRAEVKSYSQPGQRSPRIADLNDRHIGLDRLAADHGHGTFRNGVGDESMPIHGKPRDGHEQGTGDNPP